MRREKPEGEKVISANPPPTDVAAKPAPAEMPAVAAEGGAGGAMGLGMMAGMGRRGGPPPAPEVKYEATAWGRYAKVLLSATEFLFIN
jgi:hypothetical protein